MNITHIRTRSTIVEVNGVPTVATIPPLTVKPEHAGVHDVIILPGGDTFSVVRTIVEQEIPLLLKEATSLQKRYNINTADFEVVSVDLLIDEDFDAKFFVTLSEGECSMFNHDLWERVKDSFSIPIAIQTQW